MTDIYKANGYESRKHYLASLAEEYGLDLKSVVYPIAEILGPNEDFDGLITSLQDIVDEEN